MKQTKLIVSGHRGRILLAVAAMTAVAVSAWAIADASKIFRTLAYGVGVYQTQNGASKPVYGTQPLAGHDLVAAALGVPLGTVLSNQVLALQVDCDSTTASLVVFDNITSNSVATIATSSSFTKVQQQDNDTAAFPNRERFVAQMSFTPTNNLLGGFLTMAGRLQLDPTTGCPRAIRIEPDKLDRYFEDFEGRNNDDPTDHEVLRAGLGHAVGVVNLVFNDGTTNTVLLPFVALSVRHELQ
jgi:hypothetical protein